MAIATGTATFTATDTASVTWSPSLTSNPAKIIGHGVIVTDGQGPPGEVQFSSITNTGATINVGGPFTGTISVTASD